MFDILQYEKELEEVVCNGQIPVKIASGFFWSEGPIWDMEEAVLYFTDFRPDLIYQWNQDRGLEVYRRDSNSACGLAFTQNGEILCAESISRSITKINKDKKIDIIADKWNGRCFNSPNDVIVKSDGAVYFTDPYSPDIGNQKEIKENGVYRVDKNGEVHLLTDMNRPNGLAFSPDEKLLYVDDTNEQLVRVFQVKEDGGIKEKGILIRLDTGWGEGAADGMKVDIEGRLYITGPGGISVVNPDGKLLGRIQLPEIAANLCFGGKNMDTLFITAQTSVYALKTNTIGLPDSSRHHRR